MSNKYTWNHIDLQEDYTFVANGSGCVCYNILHFSRFAVGFNIESWLLIMHTIHTLIQLIPIDKWPMIGWMDGWMVRIDLYRIRFEIVDPDWNWNWNWNWMANTCFDCPSFHNYLKCDHFCVVARCCFDEKLEYWAVFVCVEKTFHSIT